MIGRSAVLVAALIGGALRHPMHTTLTEIVQQAGGTTITITARAFTDDLRTAVNRTAGRPETVTGMRHHTAFAVGPPQSPDYGIPGSGEPVEIG